MANEPADIENQHHATIGKNTRPGKAFDLAQLFAERLDHNFPITNNFINVQSDTQITRATQDNGLFLSFNASSEERFCADQFGQVV